MQETAVSRVIRWQSISGASKLSWHQRRTHHFLELISSNIWYQRNGNELTDQSITQQKKKCKTYSSYLSLFKIEFSRRDSNRWLKNEMIRMIRIRIRTRPNTPGSAHRNVEYVQRFSNETKAVRGTSFCFTDQSRSRKSIMRWPLPLALLYFHCRTDIHQKVPDQFMCKQEWSK